MSSQFIFAITTPVGNEAAGANERSLKAFVFTIQAAVAASSFLLICYSDVHHEDKAGYHTSILTLCFCSAEDQILSGTKSCGQIWKLFFFNI